MIMAGSSNSEGAVEPEDEMLKDEFFYTDNLNEYKQGQAEIFVKDRLRKHVQFWREIGTDPVTLDIMPFHSKPNSMFYKNNKSALKNEAFVLEAIKDLEIKGLIAKCSEKPYISRF